MNAAREVQFPERSLGRLLLEEQWSEPSGPDDTCARLCTPRGQDWGEARGRVLVPAHRRLCLEVAPTAAHNLDALTSVQPDVLQAIILDGTEFSNDAPAH